MASATEKKGGKSPAMQESGIEVDLRLYFGFLGLIMSCSFWAGLQSSSSSSSPLDNSLVNDSFPSDKMPNSAADRSKIVRDAFLVSDEKLADVSAAGKVKFDPTAAAAGEHLLVDIEGIEADFLDSESRLADAMVTTCKEAGLEMLSYHCHSLEPKGVSCVGVLLESHMSFHTWPDEGVITLDLYVTTVSTNTEQQAKQKALVPDVVDIIKKEFGVVNPDKPAPRPLNTRWSHEFRGFDPSAAQENDGIHLAGSDLALWVLSPLEMHTKNLIHSSWTQSNQRVDIWDIKEVVDTPNKIEIIKFGLKEGDPRLHTPELTIPDRYIFINGRMLSDSDSNSVQYETIVHPAMFAHEGPKDVTVLAGPTQAGSGVIREVLKHNTVSSITAWNTNSKLVEEIIPPLLIDLDDCRALIGRADSCIKDPLVSLEYFGEKAFSSVIAPETFSKPQDAIFVLDFDSIVKTTDNLVESMKVLMNALTEKGVLLFPIGTASAIHDPRADLGVHARREELFLALESLDEVAAMLVYEEPHAGNLEPDGFLLVCKDSSCRQRWYARSDQVEYQIYDRLVRTQAVVNPILGIEEKKGVLEYFDGTTMRSYQWPKKGWETVYCRREPTPWECAYTHLDPKAQFFDLDLDDEEESDFRVETTTVMEDGEEEQMTKVFAAEDMPKGSYIMAEHLASSLMVTERNLEGLLNNTKLTLKDGTEENVARTPIIEDLLEFIDEHGHPSMMEGSAQHYIEVGGTALIRRTEDPSEANLEPWVPRRRTPKPVYSPVYERHRMSMDVFVVTSRDIAEGEELVMFEEMWSTPTID